jgi:hypothetical protein
VSAYDEPRLAGLLTAFPPAPDAWVGAAQELPRARRGLDDLVRRATEDAAFRRKLIADLERTLRDEGVEPDRALVDAIRRRFDAA